MAYDKIIDPITGCWEWQGGTNTKGYGRMKDPRSGRMRPAHQIFYEQEHGPIPDGLVVDHLCRNHGCVNPDHLEPVTIAENVRRGELAKLTHGEVRKIKQLIAEGAVSGVGLARRFGVSQQLICDIKHERAWVGVG